MDSTRPVPRGAEDKATSADNNAKPANRKGERMARRELLYTVVRDSMMRAGILSANYKFKVLSLDQRGRQFLVMVDLAQGESGESVRLAEIEALIAQAAKARHDIVVTAVYWRVNEHVAIGEPKAPSGPRPVAIRQASAVTAVPAMRRDGSRFEPIEANEMEAFRLALAADAAGSTQAEVVAAKEVKVAEGGPRRVAQNYTLLTGFEDTELPDDEQRSQVLSGTQFGKLN